MDTALFAGDPADAGLSGACLPENFFRNMLSTNPFILNRASADGAERPDVVHLQSEAFLRLTELAGESVRLQRGLGVLLAGEAGAGKSHLLGRLARWAAVGNRACFVVVRGLQTDPELLPAAVLRSAGSALAGRPGGAPARTPLYRLTHNAARAAVADNQESYAWERVGRAFARLADRLAPAARRVPEGRAAFDMIFRFFRSAARAAAGKEDGTTAVLTLRWLSGAMLDASEARRLHLPPARHRDDPVMLTDPEWARQGLTALSVLTTAIGKPLILAIDQAEELDAGRFAALARFLHGLLDHAPGILAVTAADTAAIQRWRDRGEVPTAAWDRLGQFTVEPTRLAPAEGNALVRRRLDEALSPFKNVEFLYRLRADAPLFPLHLELNSCGAWARDVIEAARKAWNVEQEVLRREGGAAWLAGWAERMVLPSGLPEAPEADSSLTREQMQAAIALRARSRSGAAEPAESVAASPSKVAGEPAVEPTAELPTASDDASMPSDDDESAAVVTTFRCQRNATMTAAEFFLPPDPTETASVDAGPAAAEARDVAVEDVASEPLPAAQDAFEPTADVTVESEQPAVAAAPPASPAPPPVVEQPPASADKTPAKNSDTFAYAPTRRRTVLTPRAWPPLAPPPSDREESIDEVIGQAITDYLAARPQPRELPSDAEQVGELILNLLQQCHSVDKGYGVVQAERVPTWKATPAVCDLVVRQQADGNAILRTGILVFTANRATAIAGYLKRLATETQPFDRLFLITEEHVGLPLGPRGMEYLQDLQQRSSVQLHTLELTADEHAEMAAMRAVVRQARGGSLTVDGERITEAEAIASHHRRQRYLASRFLAAILFDALPTEIFRQTPAMSQ
jgi:hypothetical protein